MSRDSRDAALTPIDPDCRWRMFVVYASHRGLALVGWAVAAVASLATSTRGRWSRPCCGLRSVGALRRWVLGALDLAWRWTETDEERTRPGGDEAGATAAHQQRRGTAGDKPSATRKQRGGPAVSKLSPPAPQERSRPGPAFAARGDGIVRGVGSRRTGPHRPGRDLAPGDRTGWSSFRSQRRSSLQTGAAR